MSNLVDVLKKAKTATKKVGFADQQPPADEKPKEEPGKVDDAVSSLFGRQSTIMDIFAKKVTGISDAVEVYKKNKFVDLDEIVDVDAFLPKYKRSTKALGREKVAARK